MGGVGRVHQTQGVGGEVGALKYKDLLLDNALPLRYRAYGSARPLLIQTPEITARKIFCFIGPVSQSGELAAGYRAN